MPRPDGSGALLDRAIRRHGGWELWDRLESVTVRLDSLSGPLLWAKGLGRTFTRPRVIRVYPKIFRVETPDHPRDGRIGVFERGSVGIFDSAEVDARPGPADHRLSFLGPAKYRRWSELDSLYFFGYAISIYLSLPFLLKDLGARETGSVLAAEFPAEIHSHSRRQVFHFNDEGLLSRHDYTADIVGPFAHGAHFTSGYVNLNGLPIATRREVFVRVGGRSTPVPVLTAELTPLEVELRPV